MELKAMITMRKSCRSYTGKPLDPAALDKISDFMSTAKPLYPDIRVRWEIVPREQVKCICPWTTPQLITIFSEEKSGYLENVGFLFQQLDLYLQSVGIGVCWLGMGRMNGSDMVAQNQNDGLQFVMMLAFGEPKGDALRTDVKEFKRKSLSEIADREDTRLEPARLAPSGVNSQPWYFVREGDTYHAYCVRQGMLKNKEPGFMNRIDMGIALAHMYVSNMETFQFHVVERPPEKKGYGYIGSFCI